MQPFLQQLKKAIILGILLSILTFAGYSQTSDLQWVHASGATSTHDGRGVDTDAAGNSYITGGFNGTSDFDPGSGVFNLVAVGGSDVFVQKLDPNGNLIWAKSFGGSSTDIGVGIVIDNNGNVNISGTYQNTVDFDPNAGTFNLTSNGDRDIFVVQLDAYGNFNWAVGMGGTSWDVATAIDVDDFNNIYTTGTYKNTVDFDPGTGVLNLTANNTSLYQDLFVQKLDANGNFVWAKSFGGASYDYGNDIHIKSPDTVFVIGEYRDVVDFDPGPGVINQSTTGLFDPNMFILKLDGNANYQWARSIGGSSTETGHGITTDVNGDVLVTGAVQGIGLDIYIAKFSTINGATIWSRTVGGNDGDQGRCIASDGNGNVYVSGGFESDNTDFDPGAGTTSINSVGSSNFDVFILKLDANGDFVWVKTFGSDGEDLGYKITLDNFENIFLTGDYKNTVDLDPGPGVVNASSGAYAGYFIQKFKQCNPLYSSQSVTICSGDTIFVGTNTYTTTGNYVDILSGVNGCDSTVTTNLTVMPAIVVFQNLTVCNGQSITVGTNTYTSTGIYTDVLTAANGCDSTITTDLTVNPVLESTQTIDLCYGESVTVGSNTYSSTGTYVDVITTTLGCDSTVTTNLTLGSEILGFQTLIICNGENITVGSNTYTTTGVYTDILTAANGCDSTVTTNLTVEPAIVGSQSLTICYGENITVGTSTYTTNGIYTDVLTAVNGCDSTVTTDLTVEPAIVGSQSLTICNGESITVGSNTYLTTGVYTDILTAANGCDSTVTTDLTVYFVNTSIVVTGSTLTADEIVATYQWLDCNNSYAIILNDTNQSFTATSNGNYAVEITQLGCVDTSNCYSVIGVGIIENSMVSDIKLYPNPTDGNFSIDLGENYQLVTIKIKDLAGKIIQHKTYKESQLLKLTIEEPKGIYLILIESGDKKAVIKIVKE